MHARCTTSLLSRNLAAGAHNCREGVSEVFAAMEGQEADDNGRTPVHTRPAVHQDATPSACFWMNSAHLAVQRTMSYRLSS